MRAWVNSPRYLLMKINYQDLPKVVNDFITSEMLPKGTLYQQGIMTFLHLQAQSKIESILSQFKIFADINGDLDIDTLCTNLTKALEKMNGKFVIPFINYIIDVEDLGKLKVIMERYGKNETNT